MTGHYSTYLVWVFIRVMESTDGHCGYEFSWSPYRLLPFSGSSEYHNYHHINYKGNYCSLFTFWDRLCGTVNPNFYRFQNSKYEKQDKSNKQIKAKKDN
jgi:methylsterol monooxygenase/4-alpha-methyl-delta7-sterol-4alpha-methyl oxidase